MAFAVLDRPSFTYIDPTGVAWELLDPDPDAGFFTKPGIKGWGATNYTMTTDKRPRGGLNIRAIWASEARLTWPLHIWGETHMEWVQRYRALKRAFTMTVQRNKPGILRVTRPDGSAREIDVLYESGFEGEGGEGVEDWLSANPVLTLMCPDGYWRDTDPVRVPRQYQVSGSFLSPFLSVSSAQVIGSSVINNPGDVDAWPSWTITGPGTSITATNNTTGQTWTLSKALNIGELITITTQRPTVRGPAGENLIDLLNWPTAYLWGLLPGDNDVTFTVAGAGGGTTIELVFYPRYEGA